MLAALGLAGVVAVAWLARGASSSPVAPPAAAEPAGREAPALGRAAVPARESSPAQLAVPAAQREAVAPSPAVDERPRCTLLGRVEDERGRPLEGATATFSTRSLWAGGSDDPRLPDGAPGIAARTGADGTFVVEVVAPTVDRVWLDVTFDAHHTRERVLYGGTHGSARRAIGPGANDLGTFALRSAGTLSGTVVDVDGRPVVGVELGATSSIGRSPSPGAETTSDEAGRYRIEHVPAVELGVRVKAEGYLCQFVSPVEVAAGVDLPGPDFVLTRGPTLSGVVVDATGAPLGGAMIQCFPGDTGLSGGLAGWTFSGEDGRFVVHLHHDVAHSLQAELAGHASFGDLSTTSYRPGTADLRIVLPAQAGMTLRVVDARSNEPVERFRVFVREVGWTSWRPPFEDHPGGVAAVHARPGEDMIEVSAPGYRPADLLAAPGETLVRLRPGPVVSGRLVRGGAPVPSPAILYERGRLEGATWIGDGETRGRASGAEDGTFSFGVPSAGTYRVELHGPSATPLLLVPVKVPSKGALDLGDVELVDGASVSGVVELPPGVPRAGLLVGVDAGAEPTRTDASGAFRFVDLPPGSRCFSVSGTGVLSNVGSRDDSVTVELAPGEHREIALRPDPARLVAAVMARVTCAGEPVAGAQVVFLPISGGEGDHIGRTGPDGVVQAEVRALGLARVLVRGQGPPVEADIEPVSLDPATHVRIDVDVSAGWLDVVLPAGAGDEEIPEEWKSVKHRVLLFGLPEAVFGLAHGSEEEVVVWIDLADDGGRDAAGRRVVRLGPLAPGDWTLRYMLVLPDYDRDFTASAERKPWPPPFAPELEARAVVEAGRVASCRLGG